MRRLISFLGLFTSLAPPAGPVLAAGDPAAGKALAEQLCAGCHAVERGATSPLAAAPPFATFPAKWPVEHLQEALAEGIVVGHDAGVRMPEFRLRPDQIDDLIAHLKLLAE